MITLREIRLLNILAAVRAGGNPYHDPATGEFTSGPGGSHGAKRPHGKHHARRARRRARLRKKREALRKDLKAQAKVIKANHRESRRYVVKEYRRERNSQIREYRRESSQLRREAKQALRKAGTAADRNNIRQDYKHNASILKSDHAEARKANREQLRDEHKALNGEHRKEWTDFRADMREAADELRADHGVKPKRRDAPEGLSRRLSLRRIHKAGSAESILRACLRARGWTAAFRRDTLTQRQHIELLEDVRQYGRAWLRHEAESFVRHHLERGMPADLAGHFGRFFRRAKQFVRELIVGGVMAVSGSTPLTGEQVEAAEGEAVRQDRFFDRFYDELEFWGKPSPKHEPLPQPPVGLPVTPSAPHMTPGQFVARVEQYASSAWQGAQRINRKTARKFDFKVERRILGVPRSEHCDDCPPLAAKGWQPIGTLPDIGDSECGHLCLCHFEFAVEPGGKAYVQGSKKPMLAPDVHPEPEPDDGGIYPVAEPPGVLIDAPIAGPPPL